MASGGPSTTSSAILTGKPGAKFAGGNVTLVRSAPTKTPTKIAPAPPQSVVTTVASSSTNTQPTSKNFFLSFLVRFYFFFNIEPLIKSTTIF